MRVCGFYALKALRRAGTSGVPRLAFLAFEGFSASRLQVSGLSNTGAIRSSNGMPCHTDCIPIVLVHAVHAQLDRVEAAVVHAPCSQRVESDGAENEGPPPKLAQLGLVNLGNRSRIFLDFWMSFDAYECGSERLKKKTQGLLVELISEYLPRMLVPA